MNVQARREEKLRTDRLFSLFPLQKEIVNLSSNYRIGKENVCRGFSAYVFVPDHGSCYVFQFSSTDLARKALLKNKESLFLS